MAMHYLLGLRETKSGARNAPVPEADNEEDEDVQPSRPQTPQQSASEPAQDDEPQRPECECSICTRAYVCAVQAREYERASASTNPGVAAPGPSSYLSRSDIGG